MQKAVSERLAHWRSILAMPKLVGILTGAYTLLGAATWARDELVKHNPADSAWHVVDFLPHLTFWQWGFGAVVIVLVSVLETSFQRRKEANVVHGGELGKLNNEIVRLGRHIGELEERLKEGPTVLLSNVGNGINLRVESLRQDAINVRLVQVQTGNYFLSSDVVRVLKAGSTESLILHCHSREAGGSLVLQGFCSPALFFNDAFPEPEGETVGEMMESALMLLTERRMALLFDIAYSNLSGTQCYRSSFKVRWDRMQEAIVDVEPVETKIDRNPPTTAPPDVIPVRVAQLDFLEWHAGDSRSFPNSYGDAHPSWIAVKNTQDAPARTAKNVTARLEFVDSSGTTQLTVSNADWFLVQTIGTTKMESWRKDATIQGGDEQSFVLFASNDERQVIISKSAGEPIGMLGYDKWRVRIIVTSDDGQGFEGELRFTYTRSSLAPDHPAFHRIRTVPPLARQKS
jgi:hypothetical protein